MDIRVHIVGSQLKTLENTFKTCGTATTTFCMGVEQFGLSASIGKAILHFMMKYKHTQSGAKSHNFAPDMIVCACIKC